MCAMLDLPPPRSNFFLDSINCSLGCGKCGRCIKKAALEEEEKNVDDNKICAAFDGTWKKRGHSSLNGVMVTSSIDIGKVLDVSCLTKCCAICK